MSRASMMILDEAGNEIRAGYSDYAAPAAVSMPISRVEVYDETNMDQRSQLAHDCHALQAEASYTAFANGREPVGW